MLRTLRRLPLIRHIPNLGRGELWLLAALAGSAALLLGFAGIADEVLEGDTETLDTALLDLLRGPDGAPFGPGWLTEAIRDLTALGSYSVLGLMVVGALGYLLLIGKRVMALLVLIAVIGGSLVSSILKELFSRPRPDLAHAAEVFTASFPSGHALVSTVTYLTLGVLLARVQRSGRVRVYIIGMAVLLALVVGLSRLYLGVHYPTDVLAGWCLGAAWAGLCLVGAAWLQRRGAAEQPGPEPESLREGEQSADA
jgi:undecaprenyl-diphosphatase